MTLRHLEAPREVRDGLLERQQAQRALPGRLAVPHRLVAVAQRGTHGKVIRQIVQIAVEGVAVDPLDRVRDATVIAHPAAAQQFAVYGLAHERVAEGVTVGVMPDGPEQAGLLRTVEGVEDPFGGEFRRLGHDVRLAFGPRHGGRLQEVDRVLREP